MNCFEETWKGSELAQPSADARTVAKVAQPIFEQGANWSEVGLKDSIFADGNGFNAMVERFSLVEMGMPAALADVYATLMFKAYREFRNPINLSNLATILGKSRMSIHRAIDRLVELKLVVKVNDRKNNRIYFRFANRASKIHNIKLAYTTEVL